MSRSVNRRSSNDLLSGVDSVRKLQEIHEIQLGMLQAGESLTSKEKQARTEEIRDICRQMDINFNKIKDFPFPGQLGSMDSVLAQIRKGRAKKNFSAEGKSDEDLLREIQSAQMLSLLSAIQEN